MSVPHISFTILLVVQALHLLHHRLARRHISFVEGAAAAMLCVPLTMPIPAWCYAIAHGGFASVQVVGSVFIERLSPNWGADSAKL